MATTAAVLEIAVRANSQSAQLSINKMNSELTRMQKSGQIATNSTDRLNKSSRTLGGTMRSAVKYAVGLGAAYVGLQAAKQAVTATTDLAKSTLTLKKGFGLTIATASELGAVLKARGADATSTGMAFNTLSRQVEAAKKGSATATSAFKALGISQQELKSSSPDKLLFAVSDGMAKLGAGTARTAATSTLFGRGWKTIGPVLREGSAQLQDQLDLANQYGAAFGGKSITSIKDLIATERELKIAQLGLQVQFTEKIAPALIKIGLAVAGAVQWFEKLSPTVRTAALALAGLATAIYTATKAQAAFDAVAALNPYVALAAAVAIAAVLIVRHWNEIKEATANAMAFIKKHALLIGAALVPLTLGMSLVVAAIANNWGKIKDIFQGGLNAIQSILSKIGSIIGSVLSGPLNRAKGLFSSLRNVAVDSFNSIKGPVVSAGKAIISVLAKIVRVVASVISAFNNLKSAPGDVLKGAADKLNPANLFNGLQTGGVIVTGTGSGDKVPAMLEPGEVVLNRNAVSHLGGSKKANSLNAMIPRFAGGGVIGGGVTQAGKAGIDVASIAAMQLLKTFSKSGQGGPGLAGVIANANRMNSLHQPYLWGGGHGSTASRNGPWDCSGAISELLAGSAVPGFSPTVSGGFMNLFQPGPGALSIYANPEHVYSVIGGKAFGTSAENPGGGVGWIGGYTSRPGFAVRHVPLSMAQKLGAKKGKKGKGDKQKKGFRLGGILQKLQGGGTIQGYPKHGSHWIKDLGGHVDANEAATLLWQAGLSESDAGRLSRVVPGESGGNPSSVNPSSGAAGLFQILGSVFPGNLMDPRINAINAAIKWHTQGRGAWTAADSGPAGHILRSRVMGPGGTTAVPKAGKKPKKGKKKPKKGSATPTSDSSVAEQMAQDALDAANTYISAVNAVRDIQNQRIGSLNDLLGEQNLERLQRWQTSVTQNPLLGIRTPGRPSLSRMHSLYSVLPGLTDVSQIPGYNLNTVGSIGTTNVPLSSHLIGHGPIAHYARGGVVPGPVGSPQRAIVHGGETILPAGGGGETHIYFMVDGKQLEGTIKKVQRRGARGGNRPLPSAGGGI